MTPGRFEYFILIPFCKKTVKFNMDIQLLTILLDVLLHCRFQTTILNKHLQDIMEGLTAKVFRTYNASRTLEEQLNLLTKG